MNSERKKSNDRFCEMWIKIDASNTFCVSTGIRLQEWNQL